MSTMPIVVEHGAERSGHPRAGAIGPNAIIRVAEALRAMEGPHAVERVFSACHLRTYLDCPPHDMVDEREVTALHREMRCLLGGDRARIIGRSAGRRTADYLLRHRIPRAVQVVMRFLPPRQASRLLAAAITRNSWTFTGAGAFAVRHGRVTEFSIAGCPLCRTEVSATPCCDYYAGTFERLFRVLVHPAARVVVTGCQAVGDAACLFSITW